MKKKEAEFDTGRSEKMSDVQLSKKLGSYQKQARTWLCVGLVGVLGGLIAYFAVQDTALKVILGHGAVWRRLSAARFSRAATPRKNSKP